MAKLPHLDRMNSERRKIADRYLNEIKNSQILLPYVIPEVEPVWHVFSICCKKREDLEKYLANYGIGTNKHYPIPIHLQKCYQDLNLAKNELPVAENISATQLSIPIYYGMKENEVSYVIDALNKY